MSRILIYVFPALMDTVVASVGFICTVRAVQAGLSASKVANVLTLWAVAYMIACPIVGRIVNPRNAARILIGACLAVAAVCVCFLEFQSITAMYVLTMLVAFGMAFFFVAFQVFMKHVDSGGSKSIAYSTGLYTFAWSSGIAVGPFMAGFLWKTVGWQNCFLIDAGAALATAAGVYLMKHHAEAATASQERGIRPTVRPEAIDYARMPDLAWMGWLCGGVGALTFALFRGVFPSSGTFHHLEPEALGLVFFISAETQALMGLILRGSRIWMYKPLPLIAFGTFGMAGLALFAAGTTAPAFYVGAACYGVYSGTFFFYLVFHALVHPAKSGRYISINESVIGVTGIIGPLVGGKLADLHGFTVPYLACVGLVAAAITLQAIVHSRHSERVKVSLATADVRVRNDE